MNGYRSCCRCCFFVGYVVAVRRVCCQQVVGGCFYDARSEFGSWFSDSITDLSSLTGVIVRVMMVVKWSGME